MSKMQETMSRMQETAKSSWTDACTLAPDYTSTIGPQVVTEKSSTIGPSPSSGGLPTVDPSPNSDGLSAADVEKLKEHIRLFKGLPPTLQEIRKPIDRQKPPALDPRVNRTQQRRLELQRFRLAKNLELLKKKYDEYLEEEEEEKEEVLRLMTLAARAKTCEEIQRDEEEEDFENLKKLSIVARNNQLTEFRSNRNSELRLKALRTEPIITAHFRNVFEEHGKTPFSVPRKYEYPKRYQIPPIDRKNEVWYHPFDDETDIPLHYRRKSPPRDNRSRKERARPPLRPGKRTMNSEWQAKKEKTLRKRPPWHYGGCS